MKLKKYNKLWDSFDNAYFKAFEQRSLGKLPEMESSKSVAKVIRTLSKGKAISLLDAGCGMGHYYVSLKKSVKLSRYEGCDVTERFIKRAKEIWKNESIQFKQATIGKLPYKNDSFDFVMCNNVLLHIPPPVYTAIHDLIRVSKKNTIIRTPIAERTYFIKEVRDFDENFLGGKRNLNLNLKNLDDKNSKFNYFNLYEKKHIEAMIAAVSKELGKKLRVKFIEDKDFKSFNSQKETKSKTATKVINGKQVSGSIILDWYYIIIQNVGERGSF